MLPGPIRSCATNLCSTCQLILCAALLAGPATVPRVQETGPIHGLWVWKGSSVLDSSADVESLRNFCRSERINEVYISVSQRGEMMPESSMAGMIGVLHTANIRVEALLSSENADEGGKHLDKLLGQVRTVEQFNQNHPRERLDGVHLDIEPQQRPENKGPGNLRFLPGLVHAYLTVRREAEPLGLTVDADIQSKFLKGSLEQRKMLLSALPRFTLMMYELSSPTDGDSVDKKTEKVREASKKFLGMAYDGLGDARLGKMVIGLRTPDYLELLPKMLQSLEEANRADPHYLGWARHSYNDTLRSHH
jgi:hypothetical protein